MMNRLSNVFDRCMSFFTRKRCRVDVAPIVQTTEPTGTSFQFYYSSLLSTVHTKLPTHMQKSKEILIELQEQGFISKKGGISFSVDTSEFTQPRQTDFDSFTASQFKTPPRRLPKLDNIKSGISFSVDTSDFAQPKQTDIDNFTASQLKTPPRRLPKLDNIKGNSKIKSNNFLKKTKKTKRVKKLKIFKTKKELGLDEKAAIMGMT